MKSSDSSNNSTNFYSVNAEETSSESSDSASMISSSQMYRPSVLVLGSNSKTGRECIRQLVNHPSKPLVHAFFELDDEYYDDDESYGSQLNEVLEMCTTVLDLSERHAIDIQDGLRLVQPDWVVLCGEPSESLDGSYGSTRTSHDTKYRTLVAKNVSRILSQDEFSSIRVLAVSRIGVASNRKDSEATSSMFQIGIFGKLRMHKMRRVLEDFKGQERALYPIWDRTTVIRTTCLTDHHNAVSPNKIISLSPKDKIVPTLRTDRTELAECVVDEICNSTSHQQQIQENRIVNISSAWVHMLKTTADNGRSNSL